jgi:hypothetical protein
MNSTDYEAPQCDITSTLLVPLSDLKVFSSAIYFQTSPFLIPKDMVSHPYKITDDIKELLLKITILMPSPSNCFCLRIFSKGKRVLAQQTSLVASAK